MFCRNCGAALLPDAMFCEQCGAKAPQETGGDRQQHTDGGHRAQAPPRQQPVQQMNHQPQDNARQKAPRPKPPVWLWIVITAVAVAGLAVGVYFLFLAGDEASGAHDIPKASVLPESPAPPSAQPHEEEPSPSADAQPSARPTAETAVEQVTDMPFTLSGFEGGEGSYTGEVTDGTPNGHGTFTYDMGGEDNNPWYVEGEWKNGMLNGEGIKTYLGFTLTSTFADGLANGYSEYVYDGITRYKGNMADDRFNGQGTLYTKTGTHIYTGEFKDDMLNETAAAREERGKAFATGCEDFDNMLYASVMDGYDALDYPVHIWGLIMGAGEQTHSGNIIIAQNNDYDYPLAVYYRYGVDEVKADEYEINYMNAWGVIAGTFEYKDENGEWQTCPLIEAVYISNSMENYEA